MRRTLQSFRKFIGAWFRPRPKEPVRRQPCNRPLWLEYLEVRLAPTTGLSGNNDHLLQAYGQKQLSFEANVGQTAAQVQYLARGSGYALFLTSTSAVLSLQTPGRLGFQPGQIRQDGNLTYDDTAVAGVALAMNLVGANPHARVTGQDQLPDASNYFVGNDASQWHANVVNYGQVAYQDVYPGVNLIYYGNQQQLEYDFVVAPGADPRRIRFDVQGADSVSLDEQGNLVVSTASGDVLEHAPVIYQEFGGVRQAVPGQFVLLGQNEVGFQVSAYNASLPLIIDPVLTYSTYLGGSAYDHGAAIAVDASGAAYILGTTASSNFPTTTGAYQRTSFQGSYAVSVTKLNATGTALIYSTFLGSGNGNMTTGYGIAVDGSGNAYVTGYTSNPNFPTTPGAYQTQYAGTGTFVTKLNATGSALLYSTFLGPDSTNQPNGIAVDGSGNAYITGKTSSTAFPTTPGAFQTVYGGGNTNAYVTKLNATGSALVYSTYLGGNGADVGYGIAVDGAGNALVAGQTYSTNFPTTAGAFKSSAPSPAGSGDAFVTKLNATGSALVYSTYLGGNSYDGANAIALDASGNAYITGYTASTNFPTTTGAFRTTLAGFQSAVVTKLNATGSALLYSTYLGGSNTDFGLGIAVDSFGNAYVTGDNESTNFPTTTGAFETSFNGGGDAFLTKFNAAGSALLYSTYLGPVDEGTNLGGEGVGIAVDGFGSAYIVGYFGANFPTTTGAVQTTIGGGADAFVSKFTFNDTTTTVNASVSATPVGTVTYGTLVTLAATIVPAFGSTAPTAGFVDFRDGAIDLGLSSTETTSGSNAVFTLVTTPNQLQVLLGNGGLHTITAVYSSGIGFNSSTGTLAGGLKVTPAPSRSRRRPIRKRITRRWPRRQCRRSPGSLQATPRRDWSRSTTTGIRDRIKRCPSAPTRSIMAAAAGTTSSPPWPIQLVRSRQRP